MSNDESTGSRDPRKPRLSKPGTKVRHSAGYVLVYVGKGHHLAICGSYAYEHRVVAEEMLGRRLLPGEVVHHKNHDKSDNRPENLQVMASTSDHLFLHRTVSSNRRLPGEENPIIKCECGCGETFAKFDEFGRPRTKLRDHSVFGTDTLFYRIFDYFQHAAEDEVKIADVVDCFKQDGYSRETVAGHIQLLRKANRIVRVRYGVWALASEFAAMRLSQDEVDLIRSIMADIERSPERSPTRPAEDAIADHQPDAWRDKARCRERDEAIEKLRRLGIVG